MSFRLITCMSICLMQYVIAAMHEVDDYKPQDGYESMLNHRTKQIAQWLQQGKEKNIKNYFKKNQNLLKQKSVRTDVDYTDAWACSPLYYIIGTLDNYAVAVQLMKQGARPCGDWEAKEIMHKIIYYDVECNARYVQAIFEANKHLILEDSWPYGNCTMYANLLNNKAALTLCERVLYVKKFRSYKDFFDISFIYL